MAELLFKLRSVPDDEAEDIRQLLSEHEIDFYETHGGGWGVSMPGIWLHDDVRLDEAKTLIAAYQKERAIRARAAYDKLKEEGRQQTVADKIAEHPFQVLLLTLALIFVLYISLRPFLNFGG